MSCLYVNIFYYTEIISLSRGSVKAESILALLADILDDLNILNISLQSSHVNVSTAMCKING